MRIWTGIAAGMAIAALGAGVASAQSREETEQPAHEVVAFGEGIELRDYEPMIVAEVTVEGSRRRAAQRGFQRLAAYIFAQDRPGMDKPGNGAKAKQDEKIAMTSPVLQDQKIAMTSPVLRDTIETDAGQAWRTRFVMPAKYTMETLPDAPEDITLTTVPARRMAAIVFNGYGASDDLAMMEARLRDWMTEEGHEASGAPEYAFYDGPWVPPAYRRNEVMIPVELPAEDS
jgi:effector-binding domain-containing protein